MRRAWVIPLGLALGASGAWAYKGKGKGAARPGVFDQTPAVGYQIPDPDACVAIISKGQSPTVGICSGACDDFPNPPCDTPSGDQCIRLTNSPVDATQAFMPTWNATTLTYEAPMLPLGPTGARNPFERPSYNLVRQLRAMLGDPPQATFSCSPGQEGQAIQNLDRGPVPYSASNVDYGAFYSRNMDCIDTIDAAVAAAPATYGCTSVHYMFAIEQGETDYDFPINFVPIPTSAVTVSSGVATATVLENHGVVAGDQIYTIDLTTNDGSSSAPITVTSVTDTTVVYSTSAGDGPMADGVGTINLETTYRRRVETFVANLREDVTNRTTHVGPVHITWGQVTGRRDGLAGREPIAQYLLDAALADPYLHTKGSSGWLNPGSTTNAFLGEAIGDCVHTWEGGTGTPIPVASYIHFSSCATVLRAELDAKILYRARYLGQGYDGLHMTSCSQSGSTVTCCYNANGGLVRDTTNLPANGHWNGQDGLEIVYVDPSGNELIGAPSITNVALNGSSCLDLTLSAPAQDLAGTTQVDAGFRYLVRNLDPMRNGARDHLNPDNPNPGAPGWTMFVDQDPATSALGVATNLINPTASQTFELTSTLGTRPADDVAHFGFDEVSEAVSAPDDAGFPTTQGVFAFEAWPNGAFVNGRDLIRKWSAGQESIRIITNTDGGGNFRPLVQIGSVSTTCNPTSFLIAAGDTNPHHYMVIYDGTLAAGSRCRIIVDGVEVPDLEVSLPASIPDGTATLYLGGDGSATGAAMNMADILIWSAVPTDAELVDVYRSRNNLATVTPQPAYFFRPDCDDDLTVAAGVTNYGTIGTDGTGVNTEAEDRVVTDAPACEGVDGGVPDSGTPDAGTPDSGPDAGVVDSGPVDAGVPLTVANNFALECDGVDDYVQLGDQTWWDGHDESVVCGIYRESTRSNADQPIGHWDTGGGYLWKLDTRTANMLFYTAQFPSTNNGWVASTVDEEIIAGPHQQICIKWELADTPATGKKRIWRNGVEMTIDAASGGPGTVFTTPTAGGLTLCGNDSGGALWAGRIDEVVIYFDDNVPTVAQIENELVFNATNSDECTIPNYATGGRPTAPAADVRCRLENDYVCVDGDGNTVVTGTANGSPTFTSTGQACSGTYTNHTSWLPAVADTLTTSNFITGTGQTNMTLTWTSEEASAPANAWPIAQWVNTTAAGFGIQYRTSSVRMYIASASTDTDSTAPYADCTYTGAGRHNYVFSVDLNDATEIRAWEDGTEMSCSLVGTFPSSLVHNSAESTCFGSRCGVVGWGSAGGTSFLDNIAVYRQQDGQPTRAQIPTTVAFDPATEDSPDLDNLVGVPPPGCWFRFDGMRDSSVGGCSDLTVSVGALTYPAVAAPLD